MVLTNNTTGQTEDVDSVVAEVEVRLFGERLYLHNQDWQKFHYPANEGFKEIKLITREGLKVLTMELLPADCTDAPEGLIVIERKVSFNDDRFTDGKQISTERGLILNMKKARP